MELLKLMISTVMKISEIIFIPQTINTVNEIIDKK